MRNSDNNHLSRPHFDWPLLVASYMLALYGVLAITIANFNPTLGSDRSLQQLVMDANNGRLQLMWVVVSMVAVALMMTIKYDIIGRLWPVIYFVDILWIDIRFLHIYFLNIHFFGIFLLSIYFFCICFVGILLLSICFWGIHFVDILPLSICFFCLM